MLTWEAEGFKFNFYHIWDKTPIFLDQYVTYWYLILGPATVGQYLNLTSASERDWNYKENYVLCITPFF